jgi:multidrug resistance protein, MATE family
MVGRLGPESLSAATLATSVFILVAIIALGAMNAIPSLVSEARGAENKEELSHLLQATKWSGLLWGIASGILVYVSSFFIGSFGQPPQDVVLAAPFIRIFAYATPFMIIFLAIKGFFDGMEETRIGMIVSILGLILNLFLNQIFIFGCCGFAGMGFVGSAWATFTSRFLMMVAMIVILYKHEFSRLYGAAKGIWTPTLRKLLSMGFPMGLQIFFEIAAFSGAAIMIGWFDGRAATVGRSAHQIVLNMCSITYMVALGISVAGSVRVGEAFGRKDSEGIRNAGKAALRLGIVAMGVFSLILLLTSTFFTSIYGIYDKDVQDVTLRLSIIAAVFQLFDGAQCVSAGLLRGLQDVIFPTFVTFATYWLMWIPLAYYLSFNLGMGVDGIWWGDVIALGVAAVALYWRYFYLLKKGVVLIKIP